MDETPASIADIVGMSVVSKDFYEVGREEVRTFARTVHDTSPLHVDEAAAHAAGHPALLAPLTFSAAMGGPMAQKDIIDSVPGNYSLSQMLHVEQRHVFHQPLYAGDRIWRVGCIDSFRPSDHADLFVIKTQFVRADGEVVQTVWVSLLARSGGGGGGEVADELETAARRVMMVTPGVPIADSPGPTPDMVHDAVDARRFAATDPAAAQWTAGQQLPTESFAVSRIDLAHYSGVAGDPNPIHFSEEIAQIAGLDTVVAQAMLTMGLGASYLGDRVGDPAAVREYRARFTSPVLVPAGELATVDFGAKVKKVGDGQAELALTATHRGKRVLGRCTAVVNI
ncbi:MAG: MaoC family dehydratase N-terminal domain-containing protein [Gordonia sp. (in: high G+C Gram-positive bacteria)]